MIALNVGPRLARARQGGNPEANDRPVNNRKTNEGKTAVNDCPLCKATRDACPYDRPVIATDVNTGAKVRLPGSLVRKIARVVNGRWTSTIKAPPQQIPKEQK